MADKGDNPIALDYAPPPRRARLLQAAQVELLIWLFVLFFAAIGGASIGYVLTPSRYTASAMLFPASPGSPNGISLTATPAQMAMAAAGVKTPSQISASVTQLNAKGISVSSAQLQNDLKIDVSIRTPPFIYVQYAASMPAEAVTVVSIFLQNVTTTNSAVVTMGRPDVSYNPDPNAVPATIGGIGGFVIAVLVLCYRKFGTSSKPLATGRQVDL